MGMFHEIMIDLGDVDCIIKLQIYFNLERIKTEKFAVKLHSHDIDTWPKDIVSRLHVMRNENRF